MNFCIFLGLFFQRSEFDFTDKNAVSRVNFVISENFSHPRSRKISVTTSKMEFSILFFQE